MLNTVLRMSRAVRRIEQDRTLHYPVCRRETHARLLHRQRLDALGVAHNRERRRSEALLQRYAKIVGLRPFREPTPREQAATSPTNRHSRSRTVFILRMIARNEWRAGSKPASGSDKRDAVEPGDARADVELRSDELVLVMRPGHRLASGAV